MLHDLKANDGDIHQEDLQQLFEDAKKPRKDDGKLRHVTDSPQWRKIDNKFPEFSKEIRNVLFGLSSDGINPFGKHEQSLQYLAGSFMYVQSSTVVVHETQIHRPFRSSLIGRWLSIVFPTRGFMGMRILFDEVHE
ncbi:cytochrome P450 [Tanacetum coccineum]